MAKWGLPTTSGSGEGQASHPDPKIMGVLSKLIFLGLFLVSKGQRPPPDLPQQDM